MRVRSTGKARTWMRYARRLAEVEKDAVVNADSAVRYIQLHGSPRVYYSGYMGAYLEALAETVRELSAAVKQACVFFDHTAAGETVGNALRFMALMPPA